ncbi:MAG: polyhydroxyalkanoate synthesis regulator phasin [Bacteriovoracaceae bacterium]|jgi:hypothetical protein
MKKIFGRFLTKSIAALLIFSSCSLMAMDKGMVEMLKTMKLDKTEVANMVDQLVEMGRITPAQAANAKKELSGLTESDLDKYKNAAVKKIESGEASRLIDHDYKKGMPKFDTPSVVEIQEPQKGRKPASIPAPEEAPKKNTKIDFSKLGQ